VLPERGELAERLEAAGVELTVQPLAVLRRRLLNPRGLGRLAADVMRERRALAELARGASLVHSNTSVILGGGAAAKAVSVPHVVHVREIYDGAATGLAARAWPIVRGRLMQAHARICVSVAVAEQFAEGDRNFSSGTHVLHDGLTRIPRAHPARGADRRTDPDARDTGGALRDELHIGPDTFVVAVLGRIADWKGQDVLVRALAEPALAEAGAVGLIAGDAYPGEAAPDIAGLAAALGVTDRVRLLGFRRDPGDVLAAVDVVAVPSTRPDPLPNSAIEALAAGRPVVAAAHGGLPEIVRDRATGLLVRPGDPAALAKALRELADDPERRAAMGRAAAADARERFGLERMLDEVEGIYATLALRRPG
jgi:glycosyltransferase involved in cell wall biosynthesis